MLGTVEEVRNYFAHVFKYTHSVEAFTPDEAILKAVENLTKMSLYYLKNSYGFEVVKLSPTQYELRFNKLGERYLAIVRRKPEPTYTQQVRFLMRLYRLPVPTSGKEWLVTFRGPYSLGDEKW